MTNGTVHTAKTHLSRPIEAADTGEDVVIPRGKIPVARLVPIAKQPFKLGILAGELGTSPDFLVRQDAADLDL